MSAHRPSPFFALLVCLGAGSAYAEDDPRTYGVHQFSHTVWPTIIRGGRYHALQWRTLRRATVAQR